VHPRSRRPAPDVYLVPAYRYKLVSTRKKIPLEAARVLKIWQYRFWDGIPLDQAFVNSSADEKW
jgi:hypothetical protein